MVKPFSFLSREPKQKSEPLVYVDVNVAPGKKGRITVHKDDDPAVLANNFCRAYHLNRDME